MAKKMDKHIYSAKLVRVVDGDLVAPFDAISGDFP